MSGHAVRQKFVREFRGLTCNTRVKAGMIVAFYVLQLGTAIGLGWWLLKLPLTTVTGTGLALTIFFIGTRFRGLNNIVHECSHFSFCEHRESNVLYGRIAASMVMSCYRDYRHEHMTHHAHLGDYQRDLDLQGIRDFRLDEPLTAKTILRHAFTALSGQHLPYYLSINLSAGDGEGYRALKIGLIATATAFLIYDPVAAIVLVWFPFLWVFSAINYWTDCVDHGGLVGSEDELESSRNFVLPKQLSVLLFPRNDCYHLVHHLFPQVPAHHLGACHERLLADPDYRTRTTEASGGFTGDLVRAR